jgi:hypothetical protein
MASHKPLPNKPEDHKDQVRDYLLGWRKGLFIAPGAGQCFFALLQRRSGDRCDARITSICWP